MTFHHLKEALKDVEGAADAHVASAEGKLKALQKLLKLTGHKPLKLTGLTPHEQTMGLSAGIATAKRLKSNRAAASSAGKIQIAFDALQRDVKEFGLDRLSEPLERGMAEALSTAKIAALAAQISLIYSGQAWLSRQAPGQHKAEDIARAKEIVTLLDHG